MKALFSCAAVFPLALLTRHTAVPEQWTQYASADSRVRFEMPELPSEQSIKAPDGTMIRIVGCVRQDIVFQAVTVDLPEDLQLAMKEVLSDGEVSYQRQMLNDAVESFLDAEEAKVAANDYILFRKFPARICLAKSVEKRDSRVLAVVGKAHVYLFSISYPRGGGGKPMAKRFLDSIRFEN